MQKQQIIKTKVYVSGYFTKEVDISVDLYEWNEDDVSYDEKWFEALEKKVRETIGTQVNSLSFHVSSHICTWQTDVAHTNYPSKIQVAKLA